MFVLISKLIHNKEMLGNIFEEKKNEKVSV